MDVDVINDAGATFTLFDDVVHLFFKDVLRTYWTKWEVKKSVSSQGTIKHG